VLSGGEFMWRLDVQLGEVDGEPFYIARASSNIGSTRSSRSTWFPAARHVLARQRRGRSFPHSLGIFDGEEIRDLRAAGESEE